MGVLYLCYRNETQVRKYILIVVLCFSIAEKSKSQKNVYDDFVMLNDTGFTLKGEPFFPVMFNYNVSFYKPYHGELYVGQNHDYGSSNRFECFDEETCLQDLYEDFVTMKELGFNSVRIIGLDYGIWQLDQNKKPIPAIYSKDKRINAYLDKLEPPFDELLEPIGQVLDQAACAGIKVQLLTGGKRIDEPDFIEGYELFLEALAKEYNDHPALFSYDFINEPMYFHHAFKSKEEVCQNVGRWHKIVKKYAPHQWTTVGLSTSGEVYAWDPATVPVDFISFHLYPVFKEFEKENEEWNFEKALSRIKSEIYWFSKACNKPWMVGETGFRSVATVPQTRRDVDGSLDQQYLFAKETLEFTRDCGGAAYAWWQFQDMYWGAPEGSITGDYYGVLDKSRMRKPVSKAFMDFSIAEKKEAEAPSNYYRFYEYSSDSLQGTILNQYQQPIHHAVITAWDENWGNVTTTYSNEKGRFTLLSGAPIHNVSISAPGASHQMIYGVKEDSLSIYLNQHVFAMDGVTTPLIPCDEVAQLSEDPTGEHIPEHVGKVQVFPTITTDQQIHIRNNEKTPFYYTIISLKGEKVHKGFSEGFLLTVDLPKLHTGTYFIEIHHVSGEVEKQRFAVYM